MEPIDQVQELLDEVRSANSGFYRALEHKSIDDLAAVWSHQDDVKCVHPGWRLLRGWPAIRASWKRRFDEVEFQKFGVEDQFIDVHGDVAVVTMTEVVLFQAAGITKETRHQTTNLFRREGPMWKLLLHHASPRENG
ncbi:MAG: nuclear transport factor 2 family protein [Candidatus Sericytochromatia bacterium]|uniref:Nuclear transport factor 2 family protein n=1 Tax=Candidatus Tanganyikabacteria bacterium TaxID=2961651 RepID=A0A937X2T3_9BACT|nr:nuclear transport factor 2 family protein [Candidatus Tanganyikabacteria bacterium]